jgi:D-3-phosphoglycerate dehydrogenase
LLSLARNINFTDNQMHQGKWDKKIGFELAGKKVAIIGFGRIGRQVAKLIKNFGVEIMAVDPGLTGVVDGVKIVLMDEAILIADIITMHMSGDRELLGENEFSKMKNGVVLLNGARGGLISEAALAQALDSGKVRAAWLDVFSREPYDGALVKYPQLLLTSHIGSYTLECRKNMEMEAAQNLIKGFEELK